MLNTCPEPFVREKDITEGLLGMRHELIDDLSRVEPGMQDAIDKFSRMMRATHKSYGNKKLIGGYIQYVLLEGSDFEKTRLVRNLNMKLALHDRKIVIGN